MNKIILLSIVAISALAADVVVLPNISINASSVNETSTDSVVVPTGTNVTGNSASLLDNLSGVNTNYNGGLASLPSIHGMSDEEIKIDVDGMNITAACPNHMNPTLSYMPTTEFAEMEVMTGVTPVSYGGDNIGGTIIVKSKAPQFASNKDDLLYYGDLTSFVQSNNSAVGVAANVNVATDKISIGYSGFAEKAGDYRDGHGNIVADTLFSEKKQTLGVAYKINSDNVIQAKISKTDAGPEGFPNQQMDMLNNSSTNVNLSYKGKIENLKLDANAFHQSTQHYMNELNPTNSDYSNERPYYMNDPNMMPSMPMYTSSTETGYNIKATLPVSDKHTLGFGTDMDLFTLHDYWPAVPGTAPYMGPNTFENINNGHRNKFGFYLEDVAQWNEKFSTNFGVRNDIVTTNAGAVQGYSSMNDGLDATTFNNSNRSQRDSNYDITLISNYEYSNMTDIEFGWARKTRSPDLYQRYTWAGINTNSISGMTVMDMVMNNMYGDGNAYIGNVNLKPEVANTFSATLSLYDSSQKSWGIKLTPYYTTIQNYIDAKLVTSTMYVGNLNVLQFINDNAMIYGVDLSGYANVWNSAQYGKGIAKIIAGYNRGMSNDEGPLYHIMPIHAKTSLDNYKGQWNIGIDIEAVGAKDTVNTTRLEPETPAYTLINIRSGYEMTQNVRFDVSITNLMNIAYALPLGGVDLINMSNGTPQPLQGMGRSINAAMNIRF